MTLREQIVSEIMTLVRPQPTKMDPPPTIAQLEAILNSENTDDVRIETDGSVSVRPTVTTVGAVADRVVAIVEPAIERLTAERDGEREARHKSDAALRMKADAMNILFDRMRAAGVDFSDLIP